MTVHKTLPAKYYTDPDNFRAEIERFYFDSWICAGKMEQIANPGDYFLRNVGGESIIVTRDAGGVVRAFYNVCRHRGTRMCSRPRRHVCGSDPVPVSRMDLRIGWPPDRRTSHGRSRFFTTGLPAARGLR